MTDQETKNARDPAGSFTHISCEVCDYLVTEEHHIIPQSMGGSDTDENIIFVCPNHHHLLGWMVKIFIHLSDFDVIPVRKHTKYVEMLNKLRTTDPIGVKFFERIIIPRIAQIIKLEEEWGYKKTPPSPEYQALTQLMELEEIFKELYQK